MTDLADTEARGRILTEFSRTLFVEAAAGTGKTTALVGRIVGLVRIGAGTLDRIIAVTFTEKAAGEMKLRLRNEIEKARPVAAPEERNRLDRALKELELARIGTIHAFCGDLLHERPVEAGIDPLFDVASDEEADALADEAFEGWFQQVLADPPEGVQRILRRRSGRQSPREQLRSAMQDLRKHRDFPERWRRDPFDRNGAIDALIDQLTQLGALTAASSWPDDYLTRNLAEIARFVEETTRIEAISGRDYNGIEAELRRLPKLRSWGWKGAQRTTFGALSRDDVLARRDQTKADLDAFIATSDADLAPLLHETLQAPIVDYEALKAKAGRLDFLDLLIKARDLIRDDAGVRRELQERFTHFFVDEFQDTDPLQAEILFLLAADEPSETNWRAVYPIPGKLFLVGDPKQSIYRFRRADVALYEDVKQRLLGVGAELLHLTTSFRAPRSIQSFVNGAFASAMEAGPDASQASYVPLQPSRPEIPGRPTIVALPVPRPYGDYGKIVGWRITESFPEAVGAFIDWLVSDSGWTVEEDGKAAAIRPRHIAILFRRLRNFGTDVTRAYVRALETRRIQHVLVGGRSFHDREEVIALRNALTAIEWPDDELSVFATLRGPFFALGDEALLAFRQHVEGDGSLKTRRLHSMYAVDRTALDPAAAEVADALALLRRLHVGRNHRPTAETITMLLEAVRAHAGIALWPTGEQALANCQRLIDLARHFEGRASSFRAFVEKIDADAERGEADEAPIVEEGTEGVRVMTVHKAKGLEFPVVILADPTCKAARDTPSRHVDPSRRLWLEPLCGSSPSELLEAADEELKQDHAEAVRVAYVAATRARDLLVMPVCGDQPIEGWLGVLDPMLYPPDDARRQSEPAQGCPVFGEDSVVERGPQGVPPALGSVKPGLHRPVTDGPRVVWWDPAALSLEIEEQAPLRHQLILEADPDGTAAAASEDNYAAWKLARDALLAQATHPSMSVRTVTSLARAAEAETSATEINKPDGGDQSRARPDIVVETMERGDRELPGGRRFGMLVHALLATIDLDAGVDAIEAGAAINGRLVDATEEEIQAAVATVGGALAHPILRRAAACAGKGGLRRETPVLLRQDDGSLVEGTVDLAFHEDTLDFTGWTIVDFKTDRDFEAMSTRHIAQLRMYSEAVAAATGSPTRGVVLVI
ncbi:MAG: ATP-dependent deoxyribonuclease subunit A [Mesorhizobium sp.]|uniref:UvrD-helicase domain-containing protein n=1 Tax=Mesorhizobium sp. TaxID=1871066 RepID=UPI000FE919DC|nr:UvrD-helicase domain-containing protein [Mesorhizobium sp.]RWM89502.1 MAG: ATP-dependent deoxyribonuclease subunit A [Mesorhizobium sp.]